MSVAQVRSSRWQLAVGTLPPVSGSGRELLTGAHCHWCAGFLQIVAVFAREVALRVRQPCDRQRDDDQQHLTQKRQVRSCRPRARGPSPQSHTGGRPSVWLSFAGRRSCRSAFESPYLERPGRQPHQQGLSETRRNSHLHDLTSRGASMMYTQRRVVDRDRMMPFRLLAASLEPFPFQLSVKVAVKPPLGQVKSRFCIFAVQRMASGLLSSSNGAAHGG